jgi:aspartate aminotransferase
LALAILAAFAVSSRAFSRGALMFETLQPAAPDKILALIGMFRDDPRPNKVDLGVGVYKDPEGRTTVMRAVRGAEQRLYGEQTSKAYLGLAGDPAFNAAMIRLTFGGDADTSSSRRADAGRFRRAAPDRGTAAPLPARRHGVDIRSHLAEPCADHRRGRSSRPRSYPYFDAATGESAVRRHAGGACVAPGAATSCCCMAAATTRPARTLR